jgi:cell division protein FtsL
MEIFLLGVIVGGAVVWGYNKYLNTPITLDEALVMAEKEIKTIEYLSLVEEGNARATKIRAEAAALQDMDKLINYYKLEEMKALAEGSKLIYWGNSLPKVAVGSDIFNHQ